MKFIKTILMLIVTIITILNITGCAPDKHVEYPGFSVVDNKELGCVELNHEGIIYRPFGVLDSKLRGTQIGVRENEPDSKIFEVKGYDSTEWIVEHLDVIMGGGDMIFKAVGVTEIPKELEAYKEYNY